MRNSLRHIFVFVFLFSLYTPLAAQPAAIDSLEKALKKAKTDEERINVYCQLSELNLQPRPERSFRYAKKALELSRKTNDRTLISHSLTALATYYLDKAAYDSCRYYINEALKQEDKTDAPLLYFYYGQNEWFNGDYKTSMDWYHKAITASRKIKDKKTEAITYYSMAEYYRYFSEHQKAEKLVQHSIKLLENTPHRQDLAVAYNILGELQRVQSNYTGALDSYNKTLKIAFVIVDSNRIGYCLSRIGSIYYTQNKFEQAAQYMEQALDISRKTRSPYLSLFCLVTLGELYCVDGNVSKGEYYTRETISMATAKKDYFSVASAYSSLALLYIKQKEYDRALQKADSALVFAGMSNNSPAMVNAYVNKMEIYYRTKAYNKVLSLGDKCTELAKTSQSLDQLKSAYFFSYKASAALGQANKALFFLEEYKKLEDSLQNSTISERLMENKMEIAFQQKKMKDTLVYIKKVQGIRNSYELQRQQQKNLVIIVIVVAIALAAVLLTVFIIYRLQKRLNLALKQNVKSKEILLREVHHRVKNNLQIINSLLNLQLNHKSEANAKEVIKLSQDRIYTMAMIHEKLYQSANLENISIEEYISGMCQYYRISYGLDTKNITLSCTVDSPNIHIDQLIPLGLILNELIINSIKYAFDDSGHINIVCSHVDGFIIFIVEDNGKGLPPDYKDRMKNSLGIQLVQGLCKQLRATLDIENNNGAKFVIRFRPTT